MHKNKKFINRSPRSIWNSGLAQRLMAFFLAVAAAPLLIALLFVGRIEKEVITSTGRTMEKINTNAVHDAGQDFQVMGRNALSRSSTRVVALSVAASQTTSRQWQTDQAAALSSTANDFTAITSGSISRAMHQSLSTNQEILGHVSHDTDQLFARSAEETAKQSAGRVETAMRGQMDARMQERAEQLAQHVNDYVQDQLNYMALTAEMLDPQDGGFKAQIPVLDALLRRYPMLKRVSVMDTSGNEIAASAQDALITPGQMQNEENAPYFRQALADRAYIALDPSSQTGEAPTLCLAVPIELYQGKVIGVLAAKLSLSDLWDQISTVRIGMNGFASVVDSRGKVLLAPQSQNDLLQASAAVPLLHWRVVVAQPRAEVLAPINILETNILHGTDTALLKMHQQMAVSSQVASSALLSSSRILRARATHEVEQQTQQKSKELNLQSIRQTTLDLRRMQQAIRQQLVLAQQENNLRMNAAAADTSQKLAQRMGYLTQEALNKAGARLSLVSLFIVLGATLLSIIVALLLAARLVRPLILLAQGTCDLAAGDLNRRVDERAPDEIGDLAVAFNKMAASLQQSRSELRETEAQLVQSAKLASLGTLSAGVAHELNQPVAIVRGLAQQLQDEPSLPAELKQDLLLIEGQTSRMMKIIKHLRSFSRVGNYEKTEFDPYQVIHDCFVLIEAQLKSHNIDVRLDLEGVPPLVLGDANELEQVFLNLITNARDAMEGQKNPVLSIRGYMDQERCVLEFADNGAGIAEEAFSKIFDPFYTTKEAGKGTGLGLSISHSIIEKHGGTMTVHNDHGAVFVLTLPCVQPIELALYAKAA